MSLLKNIPLRLIVSERRNAFRTFLGLLAIIPLEDPFKESWNFKENMHPPAFLASVYRLPAENFENGTVVFP